MAVTDVAEVPGVAGTLSGAAPAGTTHAMPVPAPSGAAPVHVMFLNSCVSGGGAGRSLDAILSVPDPRIRATVVMPEAGVLAARLTRTERLLFVPEFVERLRRSPYSWPERWRAPWLHLLANGYAIPRGVRRLLRLVRELRPDVIHCNHMLAKPIGALLGALTATPVVFHSRACHHLWIDAAFYSWLGRRAAVRRIICNSDASAQVYRRRSAAKVCIVPNSIDLAHFQRGVVTPRLREACGLAADAFVVGFVGRIHPKKGLDWLLRSFAAVVAQRPSARLVIVGGNDASLHHDGLAAYRRMAQQLGLSDAQVIFTGYQDDVRAFVADFDVLVFPSVEPESFGRVLLEAMALEVPVITSAHGGAIEVVRDGEEGLWVPVGDARALASALVAMADGPAQRRAMGARGRQRVMDRYDRQAVARQVFDVLVAVAGEGRAAEMQISAGR